MWLQEIIQSQGHRSAEPLSSNFTQEEGNFKNHIFSIHV